MKKIIRISFATFILSITMISDMNAGPSRQKRRAARAQAQQRARMVQPNAQPTPAVATPAKKTTTQIDEEKKALIKATQDYKNAPTPQQKAVSKEKLIEQAEQVLLYVTEERSTLEDVVTGYTKEKQEAAQTIIKELTVAKAKLTSLAIQLRKKRDSLMDKSKISRIFDAIKPGKEEEYNRIQLELNRVEAVLNKINTNIKNQSIIAGEKWSKAFLLAGGILIATIGTAAAIKYFGIESVKSGISSLYQNPKQALSGVSTMFGEAKDIPLPPSVSITNTIATIGTKTIAKQDLTERFDLDVANKIWSALGFAASMTAEMATGQAISTGLGLAVYKLNQLLENSDATEQEVYDQAAEVERIAQEESSQ